jgi:hypothetical protein
MSVWWTENTLEDTIREYVTWIDELKPGHDYEPSTFLHTWTHKEKKVTYTMVLIFMFASFTKIIMVLGTTLCSNKQKRRLLTSIDVTIVDKRKLLKGMSLR